MFPYISRTKTPVTMPWPSCARFILSRLSAYFIVSRTHHTPHTPHAPHTTGFFKRMAINALMRVVRMFKSMQDVQFVTMETVQQVVPEKSRPNYSLSESEKVASVQAFVQQRLSTFPNQIGAKNCISQFAWTTFLQKKIPLNTDNLCIVFNSRLKNRYSPLCKINLVFNWWDPTDRIVPLNRISRSHVIVVHEVCTCWVCLIEKFIYFIYIDQNPMDSNDNTTTPCTGRDTLSKHTGLWSRFTMGLSSLTRDSPSPGTIPGTRFTSIFGSHCNTLI